MSGSDHDYLELLGKWHAMSWSRLFSEMLETEDSKTSTLL